MAELTAAMWTPAQTRAQVEIWDVHDPIGESEAVFRQVRDEIEERVVELIDRLRSRKPAAAEGAQAGIQVDTRRRPTRQ